MKAKETLRNVQLREKRYSARDIIGWYGVLAILLAYMLLSFKALQADGLPYQLLNLTGSLGIIYVAAGKRDTQPVVLNLIWTLIAIVAIIRIFVS